MSRRRPRPYVAQPGTLPFRALQHLGSLPPGTELSTAALAEALGQDPDAVHGCLAQARRRGALVVRKDTSGLKRLFWRLPLPGETVPTEPAPTDDDPMRQTLTRWKPKAQRRTTAEPGAPAGEPAVRLAVWSSGELAIELGEQVIVLNPREAQWLYRQAQQQLQQQEAA